MGGEGWRMVEDASGRVNGMTLQRKRTLAFIRRNNLTTVVMTKLAVDMKSGLVKALDNWWLGLTDNSDLVGLLLRVQCTQGLMTEGMRQWMNTANRGYVGCTLVAKSIKVGQRSKELWTIGSWQTRNAEDAAIDNWWQQMQGNNEGQQRRLKQWLLGMLVCWWERLEERHDENAGTIDEGAARAAGDSQLLSWTLLLPPGKKRQMTVEEK